MTGFPSQCCSDISLLMLVTINRRTHAVSMMHTAGSFEVRGWKTAFWPLCCYSDLSSKSIMLESRGHVRTFSSLSCSLNCSLMICVLWKGALSCWGKRMSQRGLLGLKHCLAGWCMSSGINIYARIQGIPAKHHLSVVLMLWWIGVWYLICRCSFSLLCTY